MADETKEQPLRGSNVFLELEPDEWEYETVTKRVEGKDVTERVPKKISKPGVKIEVPAEVYTEGTAAIEHWHAAELAKHEAKKSEATKKGTRRTAAQGD